MNSINPATLDQWQAVCDAATAGPWERRTLTQFHADEPCYEVVALVNGVEQTICDNQKYYPCQVEPYDQEFIAIARTALPLAIAALRERAWRPIAEAPEATMLLVCTCNEGWSPRVASLIDTTWVMAEGQGGHLAFKPTHFAELMPLPTPLAPVQTAAQGESHD